MNRNTILLAPLLLFFACSTFVSKKTQIASSQEFFKTGCLNFKDYSKIKGNVWIKLNWDGYKAQFPATLLSDRQLNEVKLEGSNLVGEPQFFLHVKEEKIIFKSFVKSKNETNIEKLIVSIPSQVLFYLLQSRVPCDVVEKNTDFHAVSGTEYVLSSKNNIWPRKTYQYKFRFFLEKWWLESMELLLQESADKDVRRYSVEWGGAQNVLFIPKKFKIVSTSKQLEVTWRDVVAY